MDHPRSPRRLDRREVLRRTLRAGGAALLGIPLAACGALDLTDESTPGAVVGAAAGTPPPPPAATPSASPAAEATPEVIGTPVVTFDPAPVGQGETTLVVVRQPGARSGSVRLLGQRIPLIADGEVLWAVAGVGLLAALGPTEAAFLTRDRRGDVASEWIEPIEVVTVDRPVDYLTASPEVTAVLTPEAAEIEAALRAYEQFNLFEARPRWDGRLRLPCEGIMTTAFGQGRSINGGPVTGQHSGTDIANKEGTPILAAADGRVAWAGEMPIRGNSVLVDHGAGVVTGYHHLLDFDIDVGQAVAAGEAIARMGSTGFSTGPHLHWEMTIYGVNVDPMTWTERVFRPRA